MENPYASPTSEILSEADANSDTGLPPFGIKHFFIWLGLFVLLQLLALWAESTVQQGSLSPAYRIWSVIELIRIAAVFMGGVVLFTSRKARGVVFHHPGHWLILISCVNDLFNCITGYWYYSSQLPGEINSLGNLFSAVSLFVLVCAAVWTHGVWRCLFAAIALRPVVFGLAYRIFLRYGLSLRFLSSMFDVSVVIFAICEAATGVTRDWVHWLGVASFAIGASFPLWFWIFGV